MFKNKRSLQLIALMTALLIFALTFAACSGGEGETADTSGAPAQTDPIQTEPADTEPEDTKGGFNWDKDPSEYDPNGSQGTPVQKPDPGEDEKDPDDDKPTDPGTELPTEDPKNEPTDDTADDILGEDTTPGTSTTQPEYKDDIAEDPFED